MNYGIAGMRQNRSKFIFAAGPVEVPDLKRKIWVLLKSGILVFHLGALA
jgi:hypothetical protein